MNVNLTPELEKYVKTKIKTGLYNSASEVVRDALRLLEEQDRFKEIKLQMLREEIQKGIAELDAGQVSKLTMADIKRLGREKAKKPTR